MKDPNSGEISWDRKLFIYDNQRILCVVLYWFSCIYQDVLISHVQTLSEAFVCVVVYAFFTGMEATSTSNKKR
jgi:hypothetical protein